MRSGDEPCYACRSRRTSTTSAGSTPVPCSPWRRCPEASLFRTAFDAKRFYPIVGEMGIRFVAPAKTATIVDARMADDEIERATADLEAREVKVRVGADSL